MNKFLLFCGALCSAAGSILMGITTASDKPKKEKIGDYLVGVAGILAGVGAGVTFAAEKEKEKKEEAYTSSFYFLFFP